MKDQNLSRMCCNFYWYLPITQRKKGTKTVPLVHHFGNSCLENSAFFGEKGTVKQSPKRYHYTDSQTVPQGHHFGSTYFLNGVLSNELHYLPALCHAACGKVTRVNENQIQHMKLHHFFLYNVVISATHSLCIWKNILWSAGPTLGYVK